MPMNMLWRKRFGKLAILVYLIMAIAHFRVYPVIIWIPYSSLSGKRV